MVFRMWQDCNSSWKHCYTRHCCSLEPRVLPQWPHLPLPGCVDIRGTLTTWRLHRGLKTNPEIYNNKGGKQKAQSSLLGQMFPWFWSLTLPYLRLCFHVPVSWEPCGGMRLGVAVCGVAGVLREAVREWSNHVIILGGSFFLSGVVHKGR